ncbi:glycine cleavage system protein H [Achromatium sp. WMS2]|nr:glycine cleavage system protein H [Achromatium sp. WMS2]
MSDIPEYFKYTAEHEWVRHEGKGIICVGITDHAQSQLGDLVFVELPSVGTTLERGDECAVVESVKAASDVYSPLSGEVIEINTTLEDSPELINQDPYGEGWMFKLQLNDSDDLNELMDAAAYTGLVEAEEH